MEQGIGKCKKVIDSARFNLSNNVFNGDSGHRQILGTEYCGFYYSFDFTRISASSKNSSILLNFINHAYLLIIPIIS